LKEGLNDYQPLRVKFAKEQYKRVNCGLITDALSIGSVAYQADCNQEPPCRNAHKFEKIVSDLGGVPVFASKEAIKQLEHGRLIIPPDGIVDFLSNLANNNSVPEDDERFKPVEVAKEHEESIKQVCTDNDANEALSDEPVDEWFNKDGEIKQPDEFADISPDKYFNDHGTPIERARSLGKPFNENQFNKTIESIKRNNNLTAVANELNMSRNTVYHYAKIGIERGLLDKTEYNLRKSGKGGDRSFKPGLRIMPINQEVFNRFKNVFNKTEVGVEIDLKRFFYEEGVIIDNSDGTYLAIKDFIKKLKDIKLLNELTPSRFVKRGNDYGVQTIEQEAADN
jgi:hypothetical protein